MANMGRLYKIDDKKRIRIPEDMLNMLHLKAGDYVKPEIRNGALILKKVHTE